MTHFSVQRQFWTTFPSSLLSTLHPFVNFFTFSLLLLSDWLTINLDDRTAQKLLWISEGATKVARTSDAICPYPNRPERYEHSPQVKLAVALSLIGIMQII